jgi:hypothetical protein
MSICSLPHLSPRSAVFPRQQQYLLTLDPPTGNAQTEAMQLLPVPKLHSDLFVLAVSTPRLIQNNSNWAEQTIHEPKQSSHELVQVSENSQ